MPDIHLMDMTLIHLQPNDLIVIRFNEHIDKEDMLRAREDLGQIFQSPIVVFDKSTSVSIIRHATSDDYTLEQISIGDAEKMTVDLGKVEAGD